MYYAPGPYPPPYMYPPPMMMYYDPRAAEAKKAADLGLVLGILAFFFIGIILGPIAVYFGARAHRLDPSKGYAGMALGLIAFIIYLIYMAFILVMILYSPFM
jgi:hypothetical protein